jgi:hypothetical protein
MVSLWINPALFDLATSLDCDGHDRLHAGFLCEARPHHHICLVSFFVRIGASPAWSARESV